MYLHGKNDTFKSVNIDILFLHKNLQTFGIDHVFAQFDTNLALISWTFGSCERIYFFGKIKIKSSYLNFPGQILTAVEIHLIPTLYFDFTLK